jgi:hypothetical protein
VGSTVHPAPSPTKKETTTMGQYHYLVNLDRREFVHPHKLGCGLKLWEQLASSISTGTALIVLLASASNGQGGGDLKEGPPIIGQWRGNRIAFIGDYDDTSHYVGGIKAKKKGSEKMTGAEIYNACGNGNPEWLDVSDEVCNVIENELNGKFDGTTGWRSFVYSDGSKATLGLKPDLVLGMPR